MQMALKRDLVNYPEPLCDETYLEQAERLAQEYVKKVKMLRTGQRVKLTYYPVKPVDWSPMKPIVERHEIRSDRDRIYLRGLAYLVPVMEICRRKDDVFLPPQKIRKYA